VFSRADSRYQLSPRPLLWPRYNSTIHKQPLGSKKACRLRLRRSASGLCTIRVNDLSPQSSPWQCAIPVFEGLLPEPHNSAILDLLYTLATWHALAKLRLHTEWSVTYFEAVTKLLGSKLRAFVKSTCEEYDTRELPREVAARGRHKAASAAQRPRKPNTSHGTGQPSARKKVFSLRTYKLHALGDYPRAIRTFGTTDVYSTQPVSPDGLVLRPPSNR